MYHAIPYTIGTIVKGASLDKAHVQPENYSAADPWQPLLSRGEGVCMHPLFVSLLAPVGTPFRVSAPCKFLQGGGGAGGALWVSSLGWAELSQLSHCSVLLGPSKDSLCGVAGSDAGRPAKPAHQTVVEIALESGIGAVPLYDCPMEHHGTPRTMDLKVLQWETATPVGILVGPFKIQGEGGAAQASNTNHSPPPPPPPPPLTAHTPDSWSSTNLQQNRAIITIQLLQKLRGSAPRPYCKTRVGSMHHAHMTCTFQDRFSGKPPHFPRA